MTFLTRFTGQSTHAPAASSRRGAMRGARALVMTIVSLAAIGGCKGLLDVELPGNVTEDAFNNPAMANTLVLSAQGDFECAYSEYVHATALWSGEFMNASGFFEGTQWSARTNIYDSGTGECPTSASNRAAYTVYLPLQIARGQAEKALARLEQFSDAEVANRRKLMATAALYAAYSLTLLGEPYCEMVLDQGPVMTSQEVLGIAEQRFTTAIELASGVADAGALLNAALIGRARVRMDLGKAPEAAADAALIPEGFVFNATYSNSVPRRANTLVLVNNVNMHVSVDPTYRNLTVSGVPDTERVPVRDEGRLGQDAFTPLWTQQKYLATNAPLPIGSWDEAQLIIAEAKGGNDAVDAINRIRDKYSLPHYGGGTNEEIEAQVIEERRRTLFLTGHRISDMLRFDIPFATGANHKGTTYANNTCLPLPLAEAAGSPNS